MAQLCEARYTDGQTVVCQESDGEGLGDVVGLEIARGDCAGDDYHGCFMKK